jgi:hypothetical protein
MSVALDATVLACFLASDDGRLSCELNLAVAADAFGLHQRVCQSPDLFFFVVLLSLPPTLRFSCLCRFPLPRVAFVCKSGGGEDVSRPIWEKSL